GAFFAPTVLADVTPEMDVYREELFGPAAVVYRVADEDAAGRDPAHGRHARRGRSSHRPCSPT
ncbi:hypothetical protein CTI14_67050, partial [Methylobacterium radiotolerans]